MPLMTFGDYEVEATTFNNGHVMVVQEGYESMYSVYLRLPPAQSEGGHRHVRWIADFAVKADAILFARLMRGDFLNIGLAAIYIRTGFGTVMSDDFAESVGGHIGFDTGIVEYAEILAELCEKISSEDGLEWPGVFDYEVSERFGKWMYVHVNEHAAMPTFSQARETMSHMIADFFSQVERNENRREGMRRRLINQMLTQGG